MFVSTLEREEINEIDDTFNEIDCNNHVHFFDNVPRKQRNSLIDEVSSIIFIHTFILGYFIIFNIILIKYSNLL